MKRLAYAAFALCMLLAVGQLFLHLQHLPARIATRFDAGGMPNSFMSKSGYVTAMLGMHIGLPAFMVVIAWLSKGHDSLLNLPNKNYWLAPQRREATLKVTEAVIVWMTVATQLFLLGITQLTFVANTQQRNLSTSRLWLLMGVYLAVVGAVCGWLIMKFRIPRDNDGAV